MANILPVSLKLLILLLYLRYFMVLPFNLAIINVDEINYCDLFCDLAMTISNMSVDFNIWYPSLNDLTLVDCDCFLLQPHLLPAYFSTNILSDSLSLHKELSEISVFEFKNKLIGTHLPDYIYKMIDSFKTFLKSMSMVLFLDTKSNNESSYLDDEYSLKKNLLLKVMESVPKSTRPRFLSLSYDRSVDKRYFVTSIFNYTRLSSTEKISNGFKILEPNQYDLYLYSSHLHIVTNNMISAVESNHYLCFSLVIAYLNEHIGNDATCKHNTNEFIISGFKSGTFTIYISITNENYIVLNTSNIIIDVFDSDAYDTYIKNERYHNFILIDSISVKSFDSVNNKNKKLTHLENISLVNYYFEADTEKKSYNISKSVKLSMTASISTTLTSSSINNNSLLDPDIFIVASKRSTVGDNIILFFKDINPHSANQRFVYWACESQKLSVYKNKPSSYIITHIITADNSTFNNKNNYTIYNQLLSCGVSVLYYPCLSSMYADTCVSSLFSDTNTIAPVDHELCSSCSQQMVNNLIEINPKVVIYMNTHGDLSTDLFLSLLRTYFPSIDLGIDLPNIEIPAPWIDCCVDFVIAPSVYVALHPSIRNLNKPVFSIYPPLDPLFIEAASSIQEVSVSCTTSSHVDSHVHNISSYTSRTDEQMKMPTQTIVTGRIQSNYLCVTN